ncbi:MAG: DNA alkylation repair protein [Candidatus Micrarchaeota archaeon]|nr:DNA alkylation repair protein [Candidatus Micrarchaeota archaeon]
MQILKNIEMLANPSKAKILSGFFKTGKSEYGEGDIFIGLTVPQSREIAKKYIDLGFNDIKKLLDSKIHEHRLIALLILVERFRKANEKQRKIIYEFYMSNTKYINNWDLVDLSADKIVGEHLFLNGNKSILYELARSQNLWKRRIAIIATFAFIKKGKFTDTFTIAELLMQDKHDLIHKAVGWMLREVGKRNQEVEEEFLMKHYKKMPRTMLRYSIERFNDEKRKFYMEK